MIINNDIRLLETPTTESTSFMECLRVACGHQGHRTAFRHMVNRGTDVEHRCPKCDYTAVVAVMPHEIPDGTLLVDEGDQQ